MKEVTKWLEPSELLVTKYCDCMIVQGLTSNAKKGERNRVRVANYF